jgi:hypothetical protein
VGRAGLTSGRDPVAHHQSNRLSDAAATAIGRQIRLQDAAGGHAKIGQRPYPLRTMPRTLPACRSDRAASMPAAEGLVGGLRAQALHPRVKACATARWRHG